MAPFSLLTFAALLVAFCLAFVWAVGGFND